MRSVSFSYSLSNSFLLSFYFINEEYTIIYSQSNLYFNFPYIILYLSPSYMLTYLQFNVNNKKKYITKERLIGIVCGSSSIFFFAIGTIIMIKNKNNVNKDILDFSISDSDIICDINHDKNSLDEKNIDDNDSKDIDSSQYDIDFWI